MKASWVSVLQLLSWTINLQHSFSQQLPLIGPVEPKLSSAEKSELLGLHKTLVQIESITGNEKKVGNWLSQYLQEQGLTVEKQNVAPNRFNVLAYPGNSRQTTLLISSHIDTVPPFIPYSTENDKIRGRGSVDAKACVAAQTIAALKVLKSLESASLSLLFVVGEEKGGDGMLYFSSHAPTNYSAVIFGEPTEGKLATGHKGMLSFVLTITGKAAHSGYPWLGLSANEYMIKALKTLLDLEKKLPSSEKLGPTTLNIGEMQGGVAANVVAEKATAEIAIRIAAGTPDEIKMMINKALQNIKDKVIEKGGQFGLAYSNRAYGPVVIDTDIPGFDTIGVNYGTDIPNFKGHHKRYLYGPGSILVAHGPNESLSLEQLETAVTDYEKMIKFVLGM